MISSTISLGSFGIREYISRVASARVVLVPAAVLAFLSSQLWIVSSAGTTYAFFALGMTKDY